MSREVAAILQNINISGADMRKLLEIVKREIFYSGGQSCFKDIKYSF